MVLMAMGDDDRAIGEFGGTPWGDVWIVVATQEKKLRARVFSHAVQLVDFPQGGGGHACVFMDR